MKKEKTREHNNFCVILFVSDVATLEYNLWARDQTFRKVDWTMPLARMAPRMDVDRGRREEGQGRERGSGWRRCRGEQGGRGCVAAEMHEGIGAAPSRFIRALRSCCLWPDA
ncbi:hypothetical protein VPH35_100462 [Triticum aestivum]